MAEKDPPALTLLEAIRLRLAEWPAPKVSGGRVVVPTQVLFASGSIVRVFVEGRSSSFIVHDGGSAIDEFSNNGGLHPRAATVLRSHFREQGIHVGDAGEITSPGISPSEIAPTIALIANASREAEDYLMSRWKPRVRRNFKRLLRNMLEAEFPHIRPEYRIVGPSQKQHTFDFALERSKGGLVLVDAVHNDQNAISSAVLRNLDVRSSGQHDLEQRIIYDDAEEWRAEDLNLLKLGAKVVSFSQAHEVLNRLAA